MKKTLCEVEEKKSALEIPKYEKVTLANAHDEYKDNLYKDEYGNLIHYSQIDN